MDKRYARNIGMFSEEEMNQLLTKKVCVVGCGGLGGYILEMIARLGVKSITPIDGDVFDETNLNRQLLSDEGSMGFEKALKAKKRINEINSSVEVKPLVDRVDESNGLQILAGHDVIIDAVDNIKTRKMLQDLAEKLDIPLVHGAIAGWYGQVTTIYPGDRTFDLIYPNECENGRGIEAKLGNPSFTPALVASIQVSEAVKVMLGRGKLLRKELLYIDTLNQEYDKIEIGN
ncbi:HesA/MoeB/ThiF family protein [Alkalibacter saccharofermentans]|uniref:Molybdopterin or thiamine biosynthesis adenylyltransferase n=1 Tax=Alkalibacter saccharofermentans DSM 14828 TaxID=1120975 RepID=A0A1M4TPB9_9FIRM|nr:HesA/MoeB/ThiF family protein [Alkalibacter saccharofermentans]SHE46311.1 Molybdopterin or thiamine biosynthesis adenylyltransferase [Alkalibacter saccharofermentans DSM 14828]